MADAVPPNVEVVALQSLVRDVELSIRTQVKGGAVKRTTVVDVKKWLDAALASPVDAPKPLTLRSQRTGPALAGSDVDAALASLHDAMSKRLAEASDAGVVPLRAWLADAVVNAMAGRATIADKGPKGASVRKATAAELREWLSATEQPVHSLKD